MAMQHPRAVGIALAHVEAWSHHDWETTRAVLAPDIRALVTSTQPQFGGGGEINGAEDYMTRKAFVVARMRIALGPGGAMVTMTRSCLYLVDEAGRIKEERDSFFVS